VKPFVLNAPFLYISFPYRKAIYSSLTRRRWMEYPREPIMENLCTWLLVSVCSTWTQKTNWGPLQYRSSHMIILHSTVHYYVFKTYWTYITKYLFIKFQLLQQPSEQNPIFLPSDSETDWLLAKMFIKNADSMDHQAVQHFMKTHLLPEVYSLAALRSFSVIHPLYKVGLLVLFFFNYLKLSQTNCVCVYSNKQRS